MKFNKLYHIDCWCSEVYGNGEICSHISICFDFIFATLLQILYIPEKIQDYIANLNCHNSLSFSKIDLSEEEVIRYERTKLIQMEV